MQGFDSSGTSSFMVGVFLASRGQLIRRDLIYVGA
jgi:hypothetical protein